MRTALSHHMFLLEDAKVIPYPSPGTISLAEQRIQVAQPARNEKRMYVYRYPSSPCNEMELLLNQTSGSNGLDAEMRVLVNSQIGL